MASVAPDVVVSGTVVSGTVVSGTVVAAPPGRRRRRHGRRPPGAAGAAPGRQLRPRGDREKQMGTSNGAAPADGRGGRRLRAGSIVI